MTRKRIVFVSALAAGATLGEATAAAGYTLDYAMHLCGQEAVQDAVSRRKAYLDTLDARTRSKAASAALQSDTEVMIRATIDDSMPMRVRLSAVAALCSSAQAAAPEDAGAIRCHLRMLAGDAGQHDRIRRAAMRALCRQIRGSGVDGSRGAARGDRATGAADSP